MMGRNEIPKARVDITSNGAIVVDGMIITAKVIKNWFMRMIEMAKKLVKELLLGGKLTNLMGLGAKGERQGETTPGFTAIPNGFAQMKNVIYNHKNRSKLLFTFENQKTKKTKKTKKKKNSKYPKMPKCQKNKKKKKLQKKNQKNPKKSITLYITYEWLLKYGRASNAAPIMFET